MDDKENDEALQGEERAISKPTVGIPAGGRPAHWPARPPAGSGDLQGLGGPGQDDDLVQNVMVKEVITVFQDTDQEEVAKILETYDLLALPVVDRYHRLLGIVTFDDVIDVATELVETEGAGALTFSRGRPAAGWPPTRERPAHRHSRGLRAAHRHPAHAGLDARGIVGK